MNPITKSITKSTVEIAPAMIASELRALCVQRDLVSWYAALAAAWRAHGGMSREHALARRVMADQRRDAHLTIKSLRYWLSIAE